MILKFSDNAVKDLKKIEKQEAERIRKKINDYIKSPLSVEIIKLKGYEDLYRIRRGDYRIVFKITDNQIKVMYIMRIQHRREVYNDL